MNDESITKAFLGFKEGIVSIVRRVVNNPVDVEDIVQEAYVRSLVASRKKTIDSPKAFIARTARNLALNHITRASVRVNEALDNHENIESDYAGSAIEDQVDAERQFYNFCKAVEQLPLECRRVFTLKQVYGLTQKEIAKRLDISEKTVEYHVSKGLLRCRRYLRASSFAVESTTKGNDVKNVEGTYRNE